MPDHTLPSDAADCSRRGFLRSTCFVGAALAVGLPLGATLAACDSGGDNGGGTNLPSGVTISGNTVTLDLTKSGAAALAASGGFLYLDAASTVAVNVDGTIRAFSSLCPHEGNAVKGFNGGRLQCPTHDSFFDPVTGARLAGPARSGLTAFTVSRSGSTVTITKA